MYQDRYSDYFNELTGDIERQKQSGKRQFFAFTSNYDVILKWDAEIFSLILDRYLKEEPAAKAGDKISSMEDFARISAYCAKSGLGMNFDITDIEVCEYLLGRFEFEHSLGGTAAQGGAAISTVGFPAAIELTDRSTEVCSMLDQSDMRVVRGDKLIPVMEGACKDKPIYHIILQFTKGDVIRIGEEEVTIPLSNRLIFFYDNVQKFVPIDPDFLSYLPRHADQVSALLLSGFDAIVDMDVARERIGQISQMLTQLRQKAPQVPVYFEGAFYMNPEVKELFFRELAPFATVLGTNEEELADQCGSEAGDIDLTDMKDIIRCLELMLGRYHSRGIILHTKDYSMFYGDCPEGVNMEKGLTIGNLMSGTRARVGKYGTLDDLEESLEAGLSQAGLKLHEDLASLNLEKDAVLVPSRYMEHPRYTIGLGDTFVSGVLAVL